MQWGRLWPGPEALLSWSEGEVPAASPALDLYRREHIESSHSAMLDQQRYEDSHLGGYRRIYPGPDTEKYAPFFKHNGSLFQETAASKAREECARYIALCAPPYLE